MIPYKKAKQKELVDLLETGISSVQNRARILTHLKHPGLLPRDYALRLLELHSDQIKPFTAATLYRRLDLPERSIELYLKSTAEGVDEIIALSEANKAAIANGDPERGIRIYLEAHRQKAKNDPATKWNFDQAFWTAFNHVSPERATELCREYGQMERLPELLGGTESPQYHCSDQNKAWAKDRKIEIELELARAAEQRIEHPEPHSKPIILSLEDLTALAADHPIIIKTGKRNGEVYLQLRKTALEYPPERKIDYGAITEAAKHYEKAGAPEKAKELHFRLIEEVLKDKEFMRSNPTWAAQMAKSMGEESWAIRLYIEAGHPEMAGDILEKGKHYEEAKRVYLQGGKDFQALKLSIVTEDLDSAQKAARLFIAEFQTDPKLRHFSSDVGFVAERVQLYQEAMECYESDVRMRDAARMAERIGNQDRKELYLKLQTYLPELDKQSDRLPRQPHYLFLRNPLPWD